MKNITFSAQDKLIDELRQVAQQKNVTVNDLFRDWACTYVAKQKQVEREKRLKALEASFEKFSLKSTRKYTRDEMNEH